MVDSLVYGEERHPKGCFAEVVDHDHISSARVASFWWQPVPVVKLRESVVGFLWRCCCCRDEFVVKFSVERPLADTKSLHNDTNLS